MSKIPSLLTVQKENRNIFHIIGWWEIRRILYNVVVYFCGIMSLVIIDLMVNVPPGVDLIEPFMVIGFAMLCNIGYTFGWLTEIFIKRSKTYGPEMFKGGLLFTLVLVALPVIAHIILWILRDFKPMYE